MTERIRKDGPEQTVRPEALSWESLIGKVTEQMAGGYIQSVLRRVAKDANVHLTDIGAEIDGDLWRSPATRKGLLPHHAESCKEGTVSSEEVFSEAAATSALDAGRTHIENVHILRIILATRRSTDLLRQVSMGVFVLSSESKTKRIFSNALESALKDAGYRAGMPE